MKLFALLPVLGLAVGVGRWAPERGIQGVMPQVRAPAELRVVLGSAPYEIAVGGNSPWRLDDAWGRTHARDASESWKVERSNRRLRAVSKDGQRATAWSEEPLAVVADGAGATVTFAGHRYRGELRYVATDTAVVVVNVLPLEDYLRGVVPLEIGPRRPNEAGAVEAQAIAARSYTVVRALEGVMRPWDLLALPTDQVYGGMDAESPSADAAIVATAGLVLTYGGQAVRAPYHSTCGGSTAAPSEVWRGSTDSWLRAVSDRIQGTTRFWCDISPRFTWDRTIEERGLLDGIARQGNGRVGRVTMVRVGSLTPSGRVRTLAFDTDLGLVTMTGNDMRFALRSVGGELLNSTYFSLEPVVGREGRLTRLVLRGRGNGHGVGMCQWGAIGRARAGMTAREILDAYYPGTSLARVTTGRR
ncbi:MAG: SpoIID/LytB domain-containing protein [Cytophagaceae bacterium]|nr:SpoIID/LytB domain-containing protein [Gemmatimonadaceae bacterium]